MPVDALRDIAETTGFFSRQQAFLHGHDDKSIRRALKVRLWTRVRPGAYTFPDLWQTASDVARHRARAHAVARKLGGRVALSHVSGALEHGLSMWNADLSKVHVTRLDGGAGRDESGVVHHEGFVLPSADVVELDGIPVLRPARCALETAGALDTEAATVVLDSVLHLGACSPEDLDEASLLMRSWPGMQHVQIAVRLADGRSESVGESRTRYLCHSQGLPAPVLQHEVYDDRGCLAGTSDFGWPDHRLLGEFDGRIKYGRLLREGQQPGDAVYDEKVREDRLRELTGWSMVRVVWSDLSRPAHTAARIRRLMRSA